MSFGVITACMLAVIATALPESGNSESARITIRECALNGFGLGGTADQMREAFGEPDRASPAISRGNDYPHVEYQYDGLLIVFSMHGLSALSYIVSSAEYSLQGGVGVGSTRQEIESTLGPAMKYRSGDTRYIGYRITADDGRPLPAQLTFTLFRDIAVEFSVETH